MTDEEALEIAASSAPRAFAVTVAGLLCSVEGRHWRALAAGRSCPECGEAPL
jgi:hypothetical protein